ncbi:MAG: hypothetical protein AAF512_00700 [Pseudomonadota bacterium]
MSTDFETQAKADALGMLNGLGARDVQYTPDGGSAITIRMVIEKGVEIQTGGDANYISNGITGTARKVDMPAYKMDETVVDDSDNYRIAQPLEDDDVMVTVQLLPVA